MLIKMSMSFLNEVLKEKRALVKDLKQKMPLQELKKVVRGVEKRPFFKTFSKRFPKEVRIIAEVKRASPSRGVLIHNLDLPMLVSEYEKGGASAISVITEEKHFRGCLSYITETKNITGLPVLRKDFIVDEYEVYESKAFGADAVLFIGEVLEEGQIKDYLNIAAEIDIDVLLEIHRLDSYEKVADLKGFILGINNRDLETLKVDLSTSLEILDSIPADLPVIVESGIERREDIERFAEKGVSGFLVGTSLVVSKDMAGGLKGLRGINEDNG